MMRRQLFFLRLFLPIALLLLAGVALYGRSEIGRELTWLQAQADGWPILTRVAAR